MTIGIKHGAIIHSMPLCHVSFVHPDQREHSVEVDAEFLYEAVALAFADFNRNQPVITTSLPDTTEFVITVLNPVVEHRMRLLQINRWAAPSAIGGPANVWKRQRVRSLIGESEES